MMDFREDLKAAFNEPEESAPAEAENTPAPAENTPASDEAAPADPVTDPVTDPVEASGEAEEPLPLPSSWKPDLAERWRSMPRDLQEQVARREEQSHKEAMRLKDLAERRAWAEEIDQKYGGDLKAAGVDAKRAFDHFMGLHKELQSPDPNHRKRVLFNLAQSVGVELGGEPPPPMTAAEQAAFATQAQLQAWMKQQEEQRVMQQTMAEIEQFKASAPYFDDVREDMARLIQTGFASSLQDAYDKAVRLNGKAEREAVTPALSRPVVTPQKRAAAVSPRSSSSTAQTVVSNGDQRDVIRAALRMHRQV